MNYVLFICLLLFPILLKAEEKKVIYKYKKYEKFDFNALDVDGSDSSPGDLSVVPRERELFQNRLPNKPDFYKETIETLNKIN